MAGFDNDPLTMSPFVPSAMSTRTVISRDSHRDEDEDEDGDKVRDKDGEETGTKEVTKITRWFYLSVPSQLGSWQLTRTVREF